MPDPTFDKRPASRWPGRILVILVVIAVAVWFAAPFGNREMERPVQPATQSKDWAAEPTGPTVPVNLPKTPMTNVPDKAP